MGVCFVEVFRSVEPPKGRILVVDDHPRNLAILRKILGRTYLIATANTGEEALDLAPRFAPDLALLDIMMPGIDGYETCRRLRAIPELAHTKIIMVSAKAMVSERIAGYEAGADDYIIKPFDEDELLVKVRVYMRLKTVEEVDRLKTDILMLFSHEARTPLTTILGPIETVLEFEPLSDRGRQLLAIAREGVHRLDEYLERLIFLSSLHAGLVPFEMRMQSLTRIVRDAVVWKRTAAAERDITIRDALAEDLEAEFDARQIDRVVFAILDNAVRLSPRGSTIAVSLETEDGYACISIADQGPGVADHFLPRVFEGLEAPDATHHTAGHGLSLVTARAIVRRHGGLLAAQNHERGGAVFVVKLPLVSAARDAVPAPPAARATELPAR